MRCGVVPARCKVVQSWDFLLAGPRGAAHFPGDPQAPSVPNLRALICGSAPLARETQLFFMMLDIPVLQGYGLTENHGHLHFGDPAILSPDALAGRSRIEIETR